MSDLIQPIVTLMILSPFIGSVCALILGDELDRQGVHALTIMGVSIAWLISLILVKWYIFDGVSSFNVTIYHWVKVGNLDLFLGFLLDRVSVIMTFIITSISLLVHIYSIGYMADDPGYSRFFSYVSFFTFAMLLLVTANHFLQLFIGWEGVGVASYFLIGFWRERQDAANGSFKAFIVNRIGDFGLLMAMILLVYYLNDLSFNGVINGVENLQNTILDMGIFGRYSSIEVIAFCMWIGAMGKSAQIPLHIWLPESMAGPTPISALIHAATMVTAGVFLVCRLSPIFEYAELTRNLMLIIGSSGGLFLGMVGLVQYDIKRIVAFSTLSQLGYMMSAAAVSGYHLALFHLTTHAFFKALLFLGAGAVIIAMHHQQDIRKMGKLSASCMGIAVTFLFGSLSLSAFPPFSGFFSKDAIIEAVHVSTLPSSTYAYGCLIAGAAVTAAYSFRVYYLVFHGSKKPKEKIHRVPFSMMMPLWVLAIPSVVLGSWLAPMLGDPLWYQNALFLRPQSIERLKGVTAQLSQPAGMIEHAVRHLSVSLLLSILGLLVTWFILSRGLGDWLRKRFSKLVYVLDHRWFFDEAYRFVFVRPFSVLSSFLYKKSDQLLIDRQLISGGASLFLSFGSRIRTIQNGRVDRYIRFMAIATLSLLLIWVLTR